MSDSLTTIKVELHQCPLHQSILLTQRPIYEIFTKIFWELGILKNGQFENRPFWNFFFQKKIFFCFIPIKIMWWSGWDSILMFSLVSTKFLAMRNILLYSVFRYAIFLGYSSLNLDIWDLVGAILKIYLTIIGIVDHKTGSL